MNTIFDWKRFVMMMRWDIISYWKQMTAMTSGITFAMSIIFVLQLWSMRGFLSMPEMSEQYGEWYMMQMVGYVRIFVFFYIGAMAAFLFSNMNTKENRLAFLIQPASNLEKYLVRLLHVTVGSLICVLVALLVADLIQFIFSLFLSRGYHGSVTLHIFDRLFWSGDGESALFDGVDAWFVLAAGIWIHSLYLLGGAFFRRRAWLFTTCVFLLLVFLFVSTGFSMFMDMSDTYYGVMLIDGEEPDHREYFTTVATISALVFHLVTLFNYWASYKLFTRMQVINNKWINV